MKTDTFNQQKHFLAAMYLRLSRDDNVAREAGARGDDCAAGVTDGKGALKAESNSIGSQRELIRAFIQGRQDMELYDSYVDDGFSGTNFDRPEFKRMMGDIEAGRVNCVIVKEDCVIIEPTRTNPENKGFRLGFLCFLTRSKQNKMSLNQ